MDTGIQISCAEEFKSKLQIGDTFYYFKPDLTGVEQRKISRFAGKNKVVVTSANCSFPAPETIQLYFREKSIVLTDEGEAKEWLDLMRKEYNLPPLFSNPAQLTSLSLSY